MLPGFFGVFPVVDDVVKVVKSVDTDEEAL